MPTARASPCRMPPVYRPTCAMPRRDGSLAADSLRYRFGTPPTVRAFQEKNGNYEITSSVSSWQFKMDKTANSVDNNKITMHAQPRLIALCVAKIISPGATTGVQPGINQAGDCFCTAVVVPRETIKNASSPLVVLLSIYAVMVYFTQKAKQLQLVSHQKENVVEPLSHLGVEVGRKDLGRRQRSMVRPTLRLRQPEHLLSEHSSTVGSGITRAQSGRPRIKVQNAHLLLKKFRRPRMLHASKVCQQITLTPRATNWNSYQVPWTKRTTFRSQMLQIWS